MAVNLDVETITWKKYNISNSINVLQVGTEKQKFDEDDHFNRIDWGHWFVATQQDSTLTSTIAEDTKTR